MSSTLLNVLLLVGVAQATRLSAGSEAGRHMLKKAIVVEESKFLSRRDLAENNNGFYGMLSSMTIKYVGCSTYNQYAGGNDNRNQDQGDNNNNNQAGENGEDWYQYQQQAQNDGLEPKNYVRFTLCSKSDCGGECSGEYVMDMEDFMEDYLEWKMDHDQFWCERVRENCVCNQNNSWEECYSECFQQKDLSYQECLEANGQEGDNVFQIQQYLQCNGIKFYNPDYMYRNYNNNFQWNNFFYLGLTCSYNNVVLKPFYDEDCSYPADESEVKQAMGDYNAIPYLSGTPVMKQNKCLACIDGEDEVNKNQNQYNANGNGNGNANGNYNNNQNWNENWEDQPDATELCEMITNANGDSNAVVCDTYNTNGCEWIHETLPSLDGRFNFNYGQTIASLKDSLARSERFQWTMFALVLVLVAVLAVSVGYFCNKVREPRGPKNRAALLEYRRENAKSTDLA